MGFPGSSAGKESTCNAGDPGLILGLGRSPGGGHGNPLQCLCPENPMAREAWWATVHGVTKSGTQLSDWAQHSMYSTDLPGTQTDAKNSLTFHTNHHTHQHKPVWEMNCGLSGTWSSASQSMERTTWVLLKLHTPAARIRISVGKHTKVGTTTELDKGVLLRFTNILLDCISQWRLTGSTESQESAEVMGHGHSASLPRKQ